MSENDHVQSDMIYYLFKYYVFSIKTPMDIDSCKKSNDYMVLSFSRL